LAEVYDLEFGGASPRGAVDCGEYALKHVIDPGVVALARAVAVEGDGPALEHEGCELANGQVRPLARAVDGKEAKAQHAHGVQVVIAVAKQLARPLGSSVGRDRPLDRVLFTEGDLFVVAIDGRRGGEDEAAHASSPCKFEHGLRALEVCPGIPERVFDRGPNARLCGKVDDDVEGLAAKRALDLLELCAVGLDEAEGRVCECRGEVSPLLLGRIEGVEVVYADDPLAAGQEPLDEVAADEAGRAGDEGGGGGP